MGGGIGDRRAELWIFDSLQSLAQVVRQVHGLGHGAGRGRTGRGAVHLSDLEADALNRDASLLQPTDDVLGQERELLSPDRRRHAYLQHRAVKATGRGSPGNAVTHGPPPSLLVDRTGPSGPGGGGASAAEQVAEQLGPSALLLVRGASLGTPGVSAARW